jgi:hypothetical protein
MDGDPGNTTNIRLARGILEVKILQSHSAYEAGHVFPHVQTPDVAVACFEVRWCLRLLVEN